MGFLCASTYRHLELLLRHHSKLWCGDYSADCPRAVVYVSLESKADEAESYLPNNLEPLIVLDQFLELHKLEAKNGESVELWMALWTMGYNHNLKRDESFDFKVSISKNISLEAMIAFQCLLEDEVETVCPV